VYRWLVLSLTAYEQSIGSSSVLLNTLPDWGDAAQKSSVLPSLMALLPMPEIQRLQPLAKQRGIDINVTWCKK